MHNIIQLLEGCNDVRTSQVHALYPPNVGPTPNYSTSSPCEHCSNGTCNNTCPGSGSEPDNSSLSCGGYQCQNGGQCDYGSGTCLCQPYYAGPDCSELRGTCKMLLHLSCVSCYWLESWDLLQWYGWLVYLRFAFA